MSDYSTNWPEPIKQDNTPLMDARGSIKSAHEWREILSEDEFLELLEVTHEQAKAR